MATEEVMITAGVAASAYVAQQLFGKTLAEMGDDLNKIYKKGRDKLVENAAKKVANHDDGEIPNLRVARDVIWNGAVTEDEVCAEYFGGILAASRSLDGKDDSALIYDDCIKALSAKQLHLHHIIYSSIHNLLLKANKKINPGLDTDLAKSEVWFAALELQNHLNLNALIDLNVLHRQGLIGSYAMDTHLMGEKSLPYAKATPTTFGVLLYAASLNSLSKWQLFGQTEYLKAENISLAHFFTATLAELCIVAGMPTETTATISNPTT